MNAVFDHKILNTDLIFWNHPKSSLHMYATSLTLAKIEDEVIELSLNLSLPDVIYNHIITKSLFNFKPKIQCLNYSHFKFFSDSKIQVEIGLHPSSLPSTIERALSAAEAAKYILNSRKNPEDLLFNTESWFLLSVKQQQSSGEVGFRTIWADMMPSAFVEAAASPAGEHIVEAMAQLSQDLNANNALEKEVESMTQSFEHITHAFEQLAENISAMTQEALANSVKETGSTLEEFTERIAKLKDKVSLKTTIFEEMVALFEADEWPFNQLEEEPILEMAFQGTNDTWSCCAVAKEEEKQFIFYSLCPFTIPEDKRTAVAEFLTRANYGMVLGNFELDFEDGEIRYKTSAVLGERGSGEAGAVMREIVYTNVMIMDEYLPGIRAIIETDQTSQAAIQAIEQVNAV